MAGKGAGDIASAFGGSGKGGPTSTEKTATTGTNTSSSGSVATPNLNPLFQGFQNSLVPALTSMYQQASTPVYGTTQIAQVANAGDQATAAANSSLQANLARRGALDSGAAASGETALQQGNESNITGFENAIPLLNRQNEQQQQQNVLGLAENLTGKALSTNTMTGSGGGSTSGTTSDTTTGPAFLSGLGNNIGGNLANPAFGSTLYNSFPNLFGDYTAQNSPLNLSGGMSQYLSGPGDYNFD